MKAYRWGAAALIAWTGPAFAQAADCAYQVRAEQVGASSYEPTSPTPTLVRLRLTANPVPTGRNCQNVPVTITAANGGAFAFTLGGQTLATSVVNSSQVEGPTATQVQLNGNARKTLTDGGIVTLDLFTADPGQFLRGGTFLAPLAIRVGTSSPTLISARLTITPTFRFLPDNGSATKNLSFGDVTAGGQRSSQIYLQTNSDVLIRATSVNRGALLHEQGSAFGTITYRARYNDQSLDLSSGATTVNRLYSGMQAQVDRLDVTIEPQTGKYAGTYRDVVVLEFIAY